MNSPHSTVAAPEHWTFDHLALVAHGQDDTSSLLAELLGLKPGYRPPFPFPGRWFYQDDQASLHVIDDVSPSAGRSGSTAISHIAFRSNARAASLLPRLAALGRPYRMVRIPQSQTLQIFVQMTPGLVVELDIPAHEDDPTVDEYRNANDAP